MRIKESSIEQVREVDIVSIIGHYCDIKKSGSGYSCRSPFSEDKTASFHVNPAKNNWVCYSSDQKGDGIKFVMIRENCDFATAVEKIAGICNIVLEKEEVSEQQQLKINAREKQIKVLAETAKEYQKQLKKLDDNHWAKKLIVERNFSKDSVLEFEIGYAPNSFKHISSDLIERALFETGKEVGLISVKDGRSFDFFVDRVIFPIHNIKGEVIAFGGRKSAEEEKGPKYLNSKESEVYSKTSTIYGLYQAKQAISKTNTAVLMEGYTDVIAAHQNDVTNAIATCGTALTDKQCHLLKRFARNVIICRDNDGYDANGNDKAGTKAAMKDVDIILKAGLKALVCLLPEGEDPDSYSRKNDLQAYIQANTNDAVLWKTTRLKNKAANDPYLIADAVKEVAQMIFGIKDDIAKKLYTKECAKIFKITEKELKSALDDIQIEIDSKAASSVKLTDEQLDDLNLPKGADYQEYLKHRFVTVDNQYYFRTKEGFFPGTNFKITPLFHIAGKKNNKRLCEVVNEFGVKKLIDFDSEDFIQRARFETRLICEDNYVFKENATSAHFKLLTNRILNEFVKANELITLGWQNREKFFAFADCVYHKGVMKRINAYGIVPLDIDEELKGEESEYHQNSKHYYLPAFSEINKHNSDDDDPYENDRYFVYKQSPVTFSQWAKQMCIVYGDEKAILGICFNIASMFRNLFIKRYEAFPLMFLTGEKGSGKTKYAQSLANLFTYKQEPYDMNTATHVAFYRRIARLNNVPTVLEEFNDNIEDRLFQGVKGAYDGRGREMGKATNDNRTTTTKIKSSLIITSQYLSSRDDNSVTTRSLLAHFIKPTDPFTNEQVEQFDRLKKWEEVGLSSMLIEILDHYDFVADRLYATYSEITKRIKADLKGKEYQERMLQNYMIILTPLKLLSENIQFPFDYETAYQLFKKYILDSSDLIVESEGLGEFWKVLEFLLDKGYIAPGNQFKIDRPETVRLQTRKGEPDHVWTNQGTRRLLFLRLNAVHQLYHKEVSTREGVDVISEATIRNYFRSKKYYVGTVGSMRFEKMSTSAIVFDYDLMLKNGVLNLDRNIEGNDEGFEDVGFPV
nr:DNA primase [uncultured Flavobacterium sp.]